MEFNRQAVVVRFNPWTCVDTDRLVPDFLASLRKALAESLLTEKVSQGISNLIKAIDDYASVLVPIGAAFQGGAAVPLLLQDVSPLHREGRDEKMPYSDIESCKKKVSDELKFAFRSVVVVIDDIDRLPNDRICLLFQLVAQIADFARVHYLLAYDPSIVEAAISKLQGGSGSRYLEKIVQLEIDVPEIDASLIRKEIQGFVYQHLQRRGISETGPEAVRVDEVITDVLMPSVQTMRDLKRFCNSFDFEASYVNDGMSCADLLCMVGIKTFMPKLVPWIDARTALLCGEPSYTQSTQNAESMRHDTFEELANSVKLSNRQCQTAMSALFLLFPRFANSCGRNVETLTGPQFRMQGRIACHEVYFNYRRASLASWAYPREEIDRLLHEGLRDEIAAAFGDGAIGGYDLADEFSGLLEDISAPRLCTVTAGLLDAICCSTWTDDDSYHGDPHERILRLLLKRVGKGEASSLLTPSVRGATIEGLVRLSHLVNAEELAHARLAGVDSGERNDRQLLLLDDLLTLEKAYARRVDELSKECNILAVPGSRMLLYLWGCFEQENKAQYIEKLANEDVLNIVRLCALCLGAWHVLDGKSFSGSISSWSLSWQSFDEYLSIDSIRDQIDVARRTEDFWVLPERDQMSAAAMYLAVERDIPRERDPSNHEIEQGDVLGLLVKWRAEVSPGIPDTV